MTEDLSAGRRRNFYGRRHGKALRPNQVRHLNEVLPEIQPPVAEALADGRVLDLTSLFDGARPVWLEIGTGGGEHIVGLAQDNPGVGMIGCEPFVNGVAMLLGGLERAGVQNVRVHPGDARDLIDALAPEALERVYLLYPDPWPKARHAKRRFMSPENLAALSRVMQSGAELRLATDIPDYVDHALAAIAAVDAFEPVGDPVVRHEPWEGWRSTRYETKALREGRAPHYLVFRRQ